MTESVEQKPRRKGWKIAVIAAVCVLAAAGGIGAATAPSWAGGGASNSQPTTSAQAGASSTASATPSVPVLPLSVVVSPADGAKQVNPITPVQITATNGSIKYAVLSNALTGESVDGVVSADGTTWKASGLLKFNTQYKLSYSALDGAKQETTGSQTFSTVSSANEANAATYTPDGSTVGVGQPVQIDFSEPVINKEAVEKAIKITTTAGQVGAFHWYSNTMVRYRPEAFWAANSTISVAMNLYGVDLGNGQIGNFNKTVSMKVGDKKLIVADGNTHQAQVYVNDQLVRTMPITMGDTTFPSASGYQVMMEKQQRALFVASTIGLKPGAPGDYGQVWVNNAIRLTTSGQFMHEATPTGMSVLGVENASHGCIGLSEADSSWVFANFGTGDMVQVFNSGNTVAPPTDGFGDWNIPWAQYGSR
ncbi:L,D-transpeptidase [Psychromicrobium xiongbiense]|uniref:L,D-transpeptidase n=1 Tax=Psychromicrobium xiongbiense TaxID=3051184 RepID=UPI002557B99A|nr:Ig-like domain-containing protein [Psychromicrobium sp. YIM S02556]